MLSCFSKSTEDSVPIYSLTQKKLRVWLSEKDEVFQQWVESVGFTAKPGTFCLVPEQAGRLQCVLLGVEDEADFWSFGGLPRQLPKGVYALGSLDFAPKDHVFRACLAWGLGAYQFSRYREEETVAQLVLPRACDIDYLCDWVESIRLGRDWVNTPADVMTPVYLAETIKTVAKSCSAKTKVLVGNKLLKANYPAIYAVGRSGEYEPRLVDLTWGDRKAPLITLVGKGVCFDTGGLDLKPSRAMRYMKKDMSGAAHALSLARMIMKAQLPVRLRVLIPAVENSVGVQSYRPGDVVSTRAGLNVEIDNTDAEGRLILCDALTVAAEENPELLIDFSTLTGAARVALGPDIPAFFSNSEELANRMISASQNQQDPLWQLPLYKPYEKYLKSDIADCLNSSATGFGGAITAALYLQKFVPDHIPWMHFDFFAWNTEARHGRPKGAEMVTLRAVFALIKAQF